MFTKKNLFIASFMLLGLGVSSSVSTEVPNKKHETDYDNFERLYLALNKNKFDPPSLLVYKNSLKGFFKYKSQNLVKGDIIVMIDYGLPSQKKRLWVIDFNTNSIIYHCLVAHGKNTGDEVAYSFSNEIESNKSSLGFFATAETYIGKHGLSLRLDGLQLGLNHNARERDIVVHTADYVNYEFIDDNGYLGRSHGCPAIPKQEQKLIHLIKNKNCLYIHHPMLD